MKTICILPLAFLLLFSACNKATNDLKTEPLVSNSKEFTPYIIPKGAHYVANNPFKQIELSELKFVVQFDSSAIYKTNDPVNQYDINKLYGFSDNNATHHEYSARFGWSWNENALRSYAYVYNAGVVLKTELGEVRIGVSHQCSIKVEGDSYIFTINDHQTTIPRNSRTIKGKGYMLYPYFGGDEVAPHDIHILIRDL